MDPIQNPYAPGAGAPPPELAGRDALLRDASITIQRLRQNKFSKSMILTGLRGVGKTVLLNRIRQDAEASGTVCVRLEAPEGRSLPSLLAPGLRTALLKLDRGKAVTTKVKRGLSALAGFVGAMKVTYADVELKLDVAPEPGLADAQDLGDGLAELFRAVGEAARDRNSAVVLFVDELHVVETRELAALIVALHLTAQELLPLTMIAAGLPQIPARMGEAKTYAERLFAFPTIDRLDAGAARQALLVPAEKHGVSFTPEALDEIVEQTKGYAYFLQEWGKHSWAVAARSPITGADVRAASPMVLADLDESFFNVRFGQLTPAQKQYLRAMAELGPGPHRSGDIATVLGKKVSSVAVTREQLINKGMIYSPAHGDTAYTVPLFDGFMKRVMPDFSRADTPSDP